MVLILLTYAVLPPLPLFVVCLCPLVTLISFSVLIPLGNTRLLIRLRLADRSLAQSVDYVLIDIVVTEKIYQNIMSKGVHHVTSRAA